MTFKIFIALLILFLFIPTNFFCQEKNYNEYNQYVIKSQNTKSVDSSIYYLERAIALVPPFYEQLSSLSFYYFKKGNKKKAEHYYFKSILNGNQIEQDAHFQGSTVVIDYKMNYLNRKDTTSYGRFLNTLYDKKQSKIRDSRASFLKRNDAFQNQTYEILLQNENYYQSLRFLFYDQKVKDTVAFKYIGKYGNMPNSHFMLDLLKSNTFPERRKCARFNSQTITMLLNHGIAGFSNKDEAIEFLRLVWELVKKGDVTPVEYATAYDHYISCYVNENKSYFGTRMIFKEGQLALQDLLEPDRINDIRKDFWLSTLDDYLKNVSILPPSNYEQ